MKAYKDVAIIEGHLSSFIYKYILNIRERGFGFEHFSDETILYALLEYSQFPRQMEDEERLLYLYSKCGEFSGTNRDVTVEYTDNGNFVMIPVEDPIF
jgi:hypothetical protein